jgi:L-aspartate oxidase
MRNSLKSLLGRAAGILRTAEPLADARQALDRWGRYVLDRRLDGPAGWELQNMMTISRLLIEAAWLRRESRGAHARLDFPDRDDERWRGHVNLRVDAEPTFSALGSTEERPIEDEVGNA